MKSIKQFKFKKPINLYCFTDVHIGAVDHDAAKFNRTLDIVKKDKDGYCFFNGDNLEFIPPGYGIPESGQDKSIDEQIEHLVKIIRHLGNKVLFARLGNHENRAFRMAGIDLGKHLQRELDLPFLHGGMEEVNIKIRNTKIRLVSSHGEGGSSKRTLNNMSLTFPGADVYFTGHTHEMYHNEGNLTIDTSKGVEEYKSQIEMVGGSFLNWADYARQKNMRPTQTGCYILRLDSNGARVKGKIV